MPERGFDTGFWTDPFVRKLKPEGKLLFGYLWTNDHCNQAGCYQIDLETIAFETKLAESDLPDLLRKLYPKVQWYPDQDIIWVKNFLRRQAKSPKFLVAAKKAINHCHIPEDIKDDFELYNESLLQDITPSEHISPTKRECVIIRDRFICQYCGKEIVDASDYEMDHIIPIARGGKDNYLNLVTSCRSCNQKKIDKLPQEVGLKQPTPTTFHGAQATFILKNNKEIREKWLRLFPGRYRVVESILNNIEQHCFEIHSVSDSVSISKSKSDNGVGVVKRKGEIPPSESEVEESLSAGDREVISVWRSVKGFSMPDEAAVELVTKLRMEFPDVDILDESKVWAARKLSEPLTPKSRPSSQIWNFMRLARKFAQERRKGGRESTRTQPKQERKRPITYTRGSEPVGPEGEEDMP